jgi:hypothetical protein
MCGFHRLWRHLLHQQLNQLRRGVHVVVGTPGRILDLVKRGRLELAEVRTVVLDEADEMLSMGSLRIWKPFWLSPPKIARDSFLCHPASPHPRVSQEIPAQSQNRIHPARTSHCRGHRTACLLRQRTRQAGSPDPFVRNGRDRVRPHLHPHPHSYR